MSKEKLTEEDLKNKSLEELILWKNKEHDFLSINFPVIVSCLWIIMSIILTLNPQIWEKYPYASIYGSLILFWLIILMRIISRIIVDRHEIAEKNTKIYDKEIFKRLKEFKESDDEFKHQVINSLEDINEKLGK